MFGVTKPISHVLFFFEYFGFLNKRIVTSDGAVATQPATSVGLAADSIMTSDKSRPTACPVTYSDLNS